MHDNAYKSIFSHPVAVLDLLQGFVPEDWVAALDFSSLEKMSGSYVTDDLRDREDDLVWRVRLKSDQGQEEWLYVYLLLEFQRTIDAHMAVRLLSYVALLYQDLLKSGRVKHRLPPVFPLVLYNGDAPWTAALALEDLQEPMPAGLASYQPRFHYFLIDEGRLAENMLDQPHNTVAGLIRIERSASAAEVSQAMAQLVQTLSGPECHLLRRTFSAWIGHLINRRFTPEEPLPQAPDLPEMKQMLEERLDRWAEQLKQESMLQGWQKGLLEGREEGLQSARRMLKRQLTRRFGPLVPQTVSRIDAASLEQLELWLDAVLDAATLDEIFVQR